MKFEKYKKKGGLTIDSAGLDTNVTLKAYNKDMKVKDTREVHNVTCNAGKVETALLLIGSGTAFDDVAIAEGATEAYTAGSTQLAGTIVDTQSAATSTDTTDVAGDTAKFVATFSIGDTYAIDSTGVFNSASDMLCATTFSDINLEDGDTLEITWKVDVD